MCVCTHNIDICTHTEFKNCWAVSKRCSMLVNSRGGGLTQHQRGDLSREAMFKLGREETSWGKVRVQRLERGKNFCAWELDAWLQKGEGTVRRDHQEMQVQLEATEASFFIF